MRRPLVALALALVLPLPSLAGQVTVKEGETLSEIADRLGVPMGRLMQLNGISDPNLVEAGRVLQVPGGSGGGGGSRGGVASGGTVTVKDGETLSEIADRHGMSVERLMAINGISNPDHVEAGRRLRVSGAVTAAAKPGAGTPAGGYRRGASEHVVRPGESLSTIADGYGVPMSRLVSINGIGDPDLVQAGSSLKFCRVAEGNADIYPRLAPTCEWDTAAAQAVLEGAGGHVFDVYGSPLRYGKADVLNPSFIASAAPFAALPMQG